MQKCLSERANRPTPHARKNRQGATQHKRHVRPSGARRCGAHAPLNHDLLGALLRLLADVEGDCTQRRHLQLDGAVRGHGDLGARGRVVGANHVAVVARRQRELQRHAPSRRALAVQGHARSGAAAEADGVAARRLEVGHDAAARGGAPRHHVGDARPTVLAHPRPAGLGPGEVGRDRRGLAAARHGVTAVHRRLRRALVVRAEVVRAHDLGVAVVVREHKDGRELVELPVVVGERGAAALGVVVVEEDHGVLAGHEAPRRAEAVEVLELAVLEEVGRELLRVAKLRDLAELEVLVDRHRLPGARDDLLETEEFRVHLRQQLPELPALHVLGGVDAEARHALLRQAVDVGGHGPLDLVARGAKIRQAV
mmetsp:Transcript_56548/g.113508  ORF Transcript_56548/g.113508 Transcript_56548/m.113508 type:complete len:368 (-) Transcript_56548:460-1563(-)